MSNTIFCRINACLSLQIQSSVQHIWFTECHSFHVSWLIPLKDSEVLLNKYNKKKKSRICASNPIWNCPHSSLHLLAYVLIGPALL